MSAILFFKVYCRRFTTYDLPASLSLHIGQNIPLNSVLAPSPLSKDAVFILLSNPFQDQKEIG